MTKKKKNLPRTALGRAGKLFAMGSVMVSREVKDRVMTAVAKHGGERVQTRIKQAQDLVDTLGLLKGAAMKAGQLLSLEISDLLPPEISDILRTLHDQAPPADIALMQEVLRLDLGDRVLDLHELSARPIASASIGQVHSATVEGQKVAVKIQYPGIAKSIDSDLNLLRKFSETALSISNKKIDLGPLFEELRSGLKDEVDYRKEADALRQYRATFGSPQYAVPEVIANLSTEHVLTMSFEEGMRINDWLKGDLTQDQRNDFGHLVLQLLLDEFFKHGMVQTDPNYGNFLYRQNEVQLVLLDFGATRTYPPKFRQETRDLLKLAFDRKRNAVIDFVVAHKYLDPRESDEVKDMFFRIMEDIISMFRPENQPFDYSNPNYLQDMRTLTTNLIKEVKYSAPAKRMIFLNRKLGGMYHLLREAGCKIDLHEYWLQTLALEID